MTAGDGEIGDHPLPQGSIMHEKVQKGGILSTTSLSFKLYVVH
jgi:hypothetical protein